MPLCHYIYTTNVLSLSLQVSIKVMHQQFSLFFESNKTLPSLASLVQMVYTLEFPGSITARVIRIESWGEKNRFISNSPKDLTNEWCRFVILSFVRHWKPWLLWGQTSLSVIQRSQIPSFSKLNKLFLSNFVVNSECFSLKWSTVCLGLEGQEQPTDIF